MSKFLGTSLVPANTNFFNLNYKIINHIKDFEKKYTCIVVKTLDPDYYLLFSSINFIITEQGSALSHLAILAREYNIPVLRIDNITSSIPPQGTLTVNHLEIEVDP